MKEDKNKGNHWNEFMKITVHRSINVCLIAKMFVYVCIHVCVCVCVGVCECVWLRVILKCIFFILQSQIRNQVDIKTYKASSFQKWLSVHDWFIRFLSLCMLNPPSLPPGNNNSALDLFYGSMSFDLMN